MTIRHHMGWMLNVAESIALLDLLVNFANVATQHDSWVKPILTKGGSIAIQRLEGILIFEEPNWFI